MRDAGLGRVHWIDPAKLRDRRFHGKVGIDWTLAAVALGGAENRRPRQPRRLLEGFIASCAELAADANALVLTGGETARGILEHLDVQSLEILRELSPGIVVAEAIGRWQGRVVTKSGSFGDPAALTSALSFLRNEERMHEPLE